MGVPCPDCHGLGEIFFESKNHPGYAASNDCDRCDCTGEIDLDLSTLAHNLAIAAALCEVWYRALDEAEDHRLYHTHGYRTVTCWEPGCGRQAP